MENFSKLRHLDEPNMKKTLYKEIGIGMIQIWK